MSNFFIGIYLFFHKSKWIFYVVLIVFTLAIGFFASKIKLEENISGITKKGSSLSKDEFVIRNFKFAEKLIIHIFQSDTNHNPINDSLKQIAEKFISLVQERFDTSYIRTMLAKVDDSAYSAIQSLVSNYLPLFLSDQDYKIIDSMIILKNLESRMKRNFNLLVSPASIIIKNQIIHDPLGFQLLGMKKLQTLQRDERYEIDDGYLMTKDKKHLFIFITPANSPTETEKNSDLIDGLEKINNSLSSNQNKIKIEFFGSVAVAVGNAKQLKRDIIVTLVIALSLIFLLLSWYFRNIRIPLLGFLPALFGGGFALGVLSICKGTISAISLGIGSVILGLIIDYALYIINYYRQKQSVEAVLKEMSQTIFICCLTTAGAFLCLVFLNSSVLHDLGLFAVLSVTGAAFFSLVILPHFLSNTIVPPADIHKKNFVDKIAEIDFENKWIFIIFLTLLGVISLFFVKKVSFEKDLMSLNYLSPTLMKAEKNLDILGGKSLRNVYVISYAKTREEAIRKNEMASDELEKLLQNNQINSYSGIQNLFLSDSMQLERIKKWERFWTTAKKTILKKSLTDAAIKTHFKINSLEHFFNLIDKKYSLIPSDQYISFQNKFFGDWINEKDGMIMVSSLVKVNPEEKFNVYHALNDTPGIIVFDRQNLTSRFVSDVKNDFTLLVNLSMIFVTILLLVSFGRIELGLTAALPMFFSWMVTLGFMGLTGIKFNIFNIIISSFVFGLGVDYSILMLRGMLYEFKFGTKERNSFKVSIFLSSTTTLFGVAALLAARHPALRSIALISIVGIISVVMTSCTIEPLLAKWFLFDRLKKHKFPVTVRIIIKTVITWGNIVLISIIMMILGSIIYNIIPISRKKKKYLFHKIFSVLCRAYIFVTFPTNGRLINPNGEDFTKPCIIISNHQSLIETPAFLRLYPKILILTSSWVFKSPVFGLIARMSGFINVDKGLELSLEKLRVHMAEGYSLLVFPEGHRSPDHRIQRFHRGAFYLAEKLQVDILPILVFGTGEFLAKGDFWGKPNGMFMYVMDRIAFDDPSFGRNYSERTRQLRKFYISQYNKAKIRDGNAFYYRKQLLHNYVFKGPVLEWYLRIKMKLENNYDLYLRLMPAKGEILDIGCGFGYLSYLLSFTSGERQITGVDYDMEKIQIADNCFSKNERLAFICEDITRMDIGKKDGFLLLDALHYFPVKDQIALLEKCSENLNESGIILIRDANTDLEKRHIWVRVTEFFSTKFGFNKTQNNNRQLFFTSANTIISVAQNKGLTFEIIDNKKITSNNIYILSNHPVKKD